jgi:hypothetical protein
MAGAVGIVLTLRAQHEAVETTALADGVKARLATGEQFVDVGLVRDVEDKLVFWRGENVVHGEGELDDAEVGAEVAAGF